MVILEKETFEKFGYYPRDLKVNKNRDMWERRIKNKMKNRLTGWYI